MTLTTEGEAAPWGIVPVDGRGSLPYALVHGESLVASAAWSLGHAEVDLLDFTVPWSSIRTSGRALVLHDPLCPLTPSEFIEAAIARAFETATVVAGFRPVTDTIKEASDDRVGSTLDREGLVSITSPVVIPPTVIESLPEAPSLDDFAALVSTLRGLAEVTLMEAPALGRRITDQGDLALLEALSEVTARRLPS